MSSLRITRAGPLATVQDGGRPGQLRYGISASGPMDGAGFAQAGSLLDGAGGAGLEFDMSGIGFEVIDGGLGIGAAGGEFALKVNGAAVDWPGAVALEAGNVVEVTPGARGNFGYLRFDREMALAPVLGSVATNSIAGLGGLDGRALKAGDELAFDDHSVGEEATADWLGAPEDGPFRFVWGLHAELFPAPIRELFVTEAFKVSRRIDRMGFQLEDPGGVFRDLKMLSLVSDAVVPGDVQIVGGGVPSVLMRDHQPTGGYPRIATLIARDLDRFAQCRPGTEIRFQPISVAHAQGLKSR